MFGGMDMFALDVLHTEEGKDYILEINDYAMGKKTRPFLFFKYSVI